MRHIIPISGKDSLMTVIIQKELEPREYEYIYNVTGAETPEIFDWLARVESYLNSPIVKMGADLEQIIYKRGILPSPKIRFCTRESKIEPMQKYINKELATVYFGIRADENRGGMFRAKTIPSSPGIRLRTLE